MKSFQEQLEHYTDLIVRVGLNVQPHQRLLILGAPIESAPFVRALTGSAYRAGCRLVIVRWDDELLELERYRHAPRDSFAEFADSALALLQEATERGDAVLSISADDPDLLKDQDPDLVSTVIRTSAGKTRPLLEKIVRNAVNWCVVALPTIAWAKKVFPDLSDDAAVQALWEAILKTVRADQPDPVAAWKTHLETLSTRAKTLNQKSFVAVHLTGPGTNLRIGLADGHIWVAGDSVSQSGIRFAPNLPTEEVFTMPHKDHVDGEVSSTKPLSYAGTLIDGIHVVFEHGKIVQASAQQGEEAFLHLLDTDEGARRIGEVALVPHHSPISSSGLLFNNTLFDENAASHIAVGRAYNFTVKGGDDMDDQAFAAVGGNQSMVHVDWMIGSGEVDVHGEHSDGTLEPVMLHGDWVL